MENNAERNDRLNKEWNLFLFLQSLSVEQLSQMQLIAERDVRMLYPDAIAMFSENSKGIVTHVGIYNAPIRLSFKHNYRASLQFAPQLLSDKRYDYVEHGSEIWKKRTLVETWLSAVTKLVIGEGSFRTKVLLASAPIAEFEQ